jgi:hypothetical protein
MSNNLGILLITKAFIETVFKIRGWAAKEIAGHYRAERSLFVFGFELNTTIKSESLVLTNLSLYQDGPFKKIDILPIDTFLEFQGLGTRKNVIMLPAHAHHTCIPREFSSTFEVRAPKDIGVFLDLYDKAARSLGKTPLFEIREKTK